MVEIKDVSMTIICDSVEKLIETTSLHKDLEYQSESSDSDER